MNDHRGTWMRGISPTGGPASSTMTSSNRPRCWFSVILTSDRHCELQLLANLLMVSERVLLRAFQDTYRVSPSRYLRRLRLSEARRALLSAQDRMVTVTEIATLFGFAELGRFSVEYRAVFGESPSVTLRRACDSDSTQARIDHERKSLRITGLRTITVPIGSSEGRFAS